MPFSLLPFPLYNWSPVAAAATDHWFWLFYSSITSFSHQTTSLHFISLWHLSSAFCTFCIHTFIQSYFYLLPQSAIQIEWYKIKSNKRASPPPIRNKSVMYVVHPNLKCFLIKGSRIENQFIWLAFLFKKILFNVKLRYTYCSLVNI